jgi:hypothetical protein
MRLRLKFADFYAKHDTRDDFFVRLLRRRHEVEVHPEAEHLIFGRFGYDFLHHDGIRIFYTGENVRPNFDLSDYALAFDHLDFGDRYHRLPLYRIYEDSYRAALAPAPVPAGAARRKFCSYVVSNRRVSRADSARGQIFQKLSAERRVESGGRQFNNVGGPVRDKLAFLRECKFNVAFENASTPGYTTEKIIEAKAAGTVPIYWGNPLIATELNPRAFVNCHEFPDLDAAVRRVRDLDRDEAAYLAMLAEPIFPGGVEPAELREERLLDFFDHIFTQPIGQAFRRVRVGRWGRRTEKEYRRIARFDLKYQLNRLRRRLGGG